MRIEDGIKQKSSGRAADVSFNNEDSEVFIQESLNLEIEKNELCCTPSLTECNN